MLDFGIARLSHRESVDIDGATLIGTPAYMAPEHLEGAEVDARSDIYAVGLVMYELLSGHRAFVGANTAEVLQRVLAAQPTPLERLVPDIDPDLARVVAKAMVREPGDRYQDLQALRKDLSRVRRRAMQAGSDDATIVVSAPALTRASAKVPAPTQPIPVASPPAAASAPATQASRSRTQEDLALAHLAARRSALPPPLPPLPVVAASPPADDGPMPVALPAVPSSGVSPLSGAGRSTVDAPLIAAPPERPVPAVPAAVAGPSDASPRAASSSPRIAAPAAPPPVAARGAVQAPPTQAASPLPSARRGISPTAIVAGMVALLALCFVIAFVAVRSFGLLSGPSLSGLFTRTVDPKVTGPAVLQTTTPPPTASTATEVPVTVAEADTPPAVVAESPVAVPAPVEPPVTPDVTPPAAPPPSRRASCRRRLPATRGRRHARRRCRR